MKYIKNLIAAAVVSAALSACGGGGSGSGGSGSGAGSDAAINIGVFSDSLVSGLAYKTYSGGKVVTEGNTDDQGRFYYIDGVEIVFSIMGITLPRVTASEFMTPANIVEQLGINDAADARLLTNKLALLLQALDGDSNPENGISLDPEEDLSHFVSWQDLKNPSIGLEELVDMIDNPNFVVADIDEALTHYYRNELLGVWY